MQARFKLAIPEGSTAVAEVEKHRQNVLGLLTRIKLGDVVVLPPNGIMVHRQAHPQQHSSVASIVAVPAKLPAVEGELPDVELYLEFNGSVDMLDLIDILRGDTELPAEPTDYKADDRRLAWNESLVDYIGAGKAELVELVQFVTNDLGQFGYIHTPTGQAAYKMLPEKAKAAIDQSIELQNQAGALLNDIDLDEGKPAATELEAANSEETEAAQEEVEPATDGAENAEVEATAETEVVTEKQAEEV